MSTTQHPRPENGFRKTSDTLDGTYQLSTERGQFIDMRTLRISRFHYTAVIYFHRPDGVREWAWRGKTAYHSEREALIVGRLEQGRREKARQRGTRLEWADDRRQAAERMAKHQAVELAKATRAAAPELLAALKEAVIAHGPFGDDTRPSWWQAAVNAIAKAEGAKLAVEPANG